MQAPSQVEFNFDNLDEILAKKPDEFVTKNGVILKLHKVKRALVKDAASTIDPPRVPTVYIEDKERMEENPNDPGYVAALRMYNLKVGDIGTSVYIIF